MSPPASHSMASYSHTVVSLPSAGKASPKIFFDGSVIGLRGGDAGRPTSSPGVGLGHAGLREQVLVVDDGEVVHQGRDPEDLAVDGRHRPLAGEEVVPVEAGVLHLSA